MGFTSFMERKAQEQLSKRAMEAQWTAGNCIGMVFGPLSIALETALETGNADRSEVEDFIDDWLEAWRDVRHLSDRNLHRNRDYHLVRPNEALSPILLEFEEELNSIRRSPELTASEMTARIKDAYLATMQELLEFNEWIKEKGPLIGFDAAKYEAEAVRRGQKYWRPTVAEMAKRMG